MAYLERIEPNATPASLGGHYERLLSSVGSEEFTEVAFEAVRATTDGVRRIYLFERENEQSVELRHCTCEPGIDALIPLYLERYWPRDPLHEAWRATREKGSLALLRVNASEVQSTGYRRRFFDDQGIAERISVIQHAEEGWRIMNVARHHSVGTFADKEISSLITVASLLLPMLRLDKCLKQGRSGAKLSIDQVDARFARRYAGLTARERQVCARAVIGMTAEATALDLDIGKTSVLTYRQRAYRKLRVSSPYELGALVAQ